MESKKQTNRGEGGFTLVELLIVVAILAILVAVVLGNFTGLLSGSKATANDAELSIVQTAVDVKMANESLDSVPVIGTATDDMSDTGCSTTCTGLDLYPTYMRSDTSNCTYTVAGDGTVTPGACP